MLNEYEFRTDCLPAAVRFESWREQVGQTHAPVDLHSEDAAEYQAHQRVLELGAIQVWPATHQAIRFRRTPRLIRQSDPEHYHIAIPLSGTNRITWDDQKAVYKPHEMQVLDSSRAFEVFSSNGPDLFSGIGVEIPKSLLHLSQDKMGRLFARGISGQEGPGALLVQFLTQLTTDSSPYRPSDGPRLGTVVVDLVSALLAHVLEADQSLPPETRSRTLVLRIRSHIQRNLHDPGLTPSAIAAAHNISTSYLHRLFQSEHETVAAFIRHQRLERARRDLADPAMCSSTIHAIAVRWGFTRAGDFTRAFRTAYGMPPKDYRHQALLGPRAHTVN
ncbi:MULTISPECIES: helix-turn-helix domain-containing protein [Streptomyces]|uniref:Helix-turn-helix domain-containing protein n=1 Tax=Streptomyces morookaense TaxID=1970 RepID=A0A7Y7B357_STRMO|nr:MULTISPECIES: helix-turn-helix domain-containing protein [Streptomyces]MCC2276056.1 helix-turn-helix domain-containing protein [Streptomyces sp. ET3-23]NVK77771.1 helix-turn-helix domain-containing protein [Streptomyces morookaense]GHF04577.1 AraC family transcriptional regulator [Streptomyces morookaense]